MNTNIKKFTSAPLPFQGQKRKFLKPFQTALKEHFSNQFIYVDLFGGSGLLSHFTRQVYPDAVVIYNDFDNYSERLRNVDKTNEILTKLRAILSGYPSMKLISEPYRSEIVNLLTEADKNGFVDFITISSSLLFSMKYATSLKAFCKETFYNNIRQTNFNTSGYLDGIHVVRCDYKELFARYRHQPDVVFLIDPPYLSTDTGTYTGYWKLKDYLDVLHTLKDTNYFYFTSNKSNIIELCDWLEMNMSAANPFSGALKVEMDTQISRSVRYTDIMLMKKR